jgi:hypothetical protein
MKCGARPRIAVSLFVALLTSPCCAEPAPIIHYAPAENLEHVDVDLIDRAEREIDMAGKRRNAIVPLFMSARASRAI